MAKPVNAISRDFNIYKSLWSSINDAVVSPPIPGEQAKSCLLLQVPGFSINPVDFDVEKFRKDPTGMDPAYATATLVDKVPAFSHYFHDTGSHISFYWKQLLETFTVVQNSEDNPTLKAKYENAIEMLYGGPSGYKNLQKTELFENLETLRARWETEKSNLETFRKSCLKRQDWPENFELCAEPYMDRVNDAFTEYDNLRGQIMQYQAAIFQYTRGDASILLLQQRQGEAKESVAKYENLEKFRCSLHGRSPHISELHCSGVLAIAATYLNERI